MPSSGITAAGKSEAETPGATFPRSDGPSRMPATISPTTGGWRRMRKIAPTPRAAAMIVTSATSTCSISGFRRDHLGPHLLHRAEHLADLIVEEVADEQIGQVAFVVRVSPDERAEAEP